MDKDEHFDGCKASALLENKETKFIWSNRCIYETSLFIAERRRCVLGPSWHHVVEAPRGPTS